MAEGAGELASSGPGCRLAISKVGLSSCRLEGTWRAGGTLGWSGRCVQACLRKMAFLSPPFRTGPVLGVLVWA